MREFTTWIGVGIVFLMALLAKDWIVKPKTGLSLGGGYGVTSRSCTMATSSFATIGSQTSNGAGVVLAAHSQRAWARISMPDEASTTDYLSFDEGANAQIGYGIPLYPSVKAGVTSSPAYIDFGLNTDFPYTGEVRGMNDLSAVGASTTLLVTECRY